MASEQDLTSLREEIDAIDDAILELMKHRLALSRQAAMLRTDGPLHLRPRREAAVIDRLRAAAADIDPRVVETVWRELIGQGRQLQAPLILVLHASGDRRVFEARVRRHFGSATPVRWAGAAAEALRQACDAAAVAVLDEPPEVLEEGLVLFDLVRDPEGAVVDYAVARLTPGEAIG